MEAPTSGNSTYTTSSKCSGRSGIKVLIDNRSGIRLRQPHPVSSPESPVLPAAISNLPAEQSDLRHLIPLSTFLQRYGFPQSHLREFLRKNRSLLDITTSETEKFLDLGFWKKWDKVFSELGFCDVSKVVQLALEPCEKLQIDPTFSIINLGILKNVGCSYETLVIILEEYPEVAIINPFALKDKIEFFKANGIGRDEIDRVLSLFPGILGFSLEHKLKPLFEEFDDLGFQKDEIRKAVVNNPRVLTVELGELLKCVQLLRNLKCRFAIQEKILCRERFRGAIEVKLRVDCLCRHGLIRREAFKVLLGEPRILIYELDDIERKIDFLLHKMGFKVSSLIEVPEYLGVNLEKHVIPRHNVIEYLRSKGGLGYELHLKDLVKPSRLRFYNLFVKPYPECEKIFGGFSREFKLKSRYPVGLWKMFKPQEHPKSEEDLRNIKLFMENLA